MGFFDFIFGYRDRKIKDFLKKGAILLDVRTQREFDSGSINGSINIPLQELHIRFNEIKILNKPVIVFCASGIRSAKAAKFLSLQNIEAINGGGWRSLNDKLK